MRVELPLCGFKQCNHGVTPGMLEGRFVGYLPLNVLEAAVKAMGRGV